VISGAVEGLADEAVLRRLIRHVGATPGPIYGKTGKLALRRNLQGYNAAARWSPWVILVDLNHDAECAPPLRAAWLPTPGQHMRFRVVIREIEAWLFGDPERLARFLAVPRPRIPPVPEQVEAPKQIMVDLARHSRRAVIREDMVPRRGSGRQLGPAYISRLVEFVDTQWRPEVAARNADSLRRCLERLRELAESRR
jgi:hypothetical protein